MAQGFFLTVEGCEGAGKSSIVDLIRDDLESRGHDAVTTREPGGIEISEQIRAVILDPMNIRMDGKTEALLYAAARRQHLVEKVIPALKSGTSIVCDRFIDSSLAYQGYARGLGMDEVWQINAFAIGDVLPDLTIYLDVEPETGLKRIHDHENREINRLDLESLSFHSKVREGYLALTERYPNRMVTVNANQDKPDVMRDVKQVLDRFFQTRGEEGIAHKDV